MNGGMRELALFAGAGGGILGGHLLGWRTVCAVERDPYAASVLCARQNEGSLPPFPIWDDVRTFDGRPWRGFVDVVSGGFPCQDISSAGNGAGITGERSGLWREMARIVGEVRPRFVFVENSPMLTSRGLGTVLGDLASLGYDARWGVLGAHDVGAPHKRDRIWLVATDANSDGEHAVSVDAEVAGASELVANATGERREERSKRIAVSSSAARSALQLPDWPAGQGVACADGTESASKPVSDANSFGHAVRRNTATDAEDVASGKRLSSRSKRDSGSRRAAKTGKSSGHDCYADRSGLAIGESERSNTRSEFTAAIGADWWIFEPDVGRVANGVAARVDRLKAVGNGQVPAVAALAWRILTSQD